MQYTVSFTLQPPVIEMVKSSTDKCNFLVSTQGTTSTSNACILYQTEVKLCQRIKRFLVLSCFHRLPVYTHFHCCYMSAFPYMGFCLCTFLMNLHKLFFSTFSGLYLATCLTSSSHVQNITTVQIKLLTTAFINNDTNFVCILGRMNEVKYLRVYLFYYKYL